MACSNLAAILEGKTMKLITKDIERKLAKNGLDKGKDHVPVVKFFNPTGSATWLITESDPNDPDILFGLCDMGMGYPEIGSVRLSEIKSVRLPFGLKIERDMYFTGDRTLSEYADRARGMGYIDA